MKVHRIKTVGNMLFWRNTYHVYSLCFLLKLSQSLAEVSHVTNLICKCARKIRKRLEASGALRGKHCKRSCLIG